MRRFALLVALVLAIGIVPIAGATSSLSIGTPDYGSTVVKDNSFSVTAAITASGVGGSGITVTATLQDNTGGAVTMTSAEQVKTYESNTSQTFTWTVTANTPGTYSGPFTVSANANDGGTGSSATGTTALIIKDRPVLALTLSKNKTAVNAGDSVRLNYSVTNSGGGDAADATDVNVTLALPGGWGLSDGTASYDFETIAPGANKAGSWIVTADSPNPTNTLTVTVTSTVPGGTVTDSYTIEGTTTELDVDTITVTPAGPLTMNVTETQTFTAVCYNDSTVVTGITVGWASSNTTVGTIDSSSGVFTAEANGTTTITATAQGVTSSAVSVTVNAVLTVDTIAVSPAGPLTKNVGETQAFTAVCYNDSTEVTGITVEWASSNMTVGTIDSSSGVFTAEANGTTTITAAAQGVTSNVVTVMVSSAESLIDRYDTDNDGVISKDEAIAAISDYFEDKISKEDALEVIMAYFG